MENTVNVKKKNTSRLMLILGLICSILWSVASFVMFLISIVIVVLTSIFAAIIVAIFSGGKSSEATNQTMAEIAAKYGWTIPVSLALFILAFIGFILAIVALILFCTAKSKKKGRVSGIIAIISGVTLIVLPFELIGGILALTLSDEQFAYRRPKKKKGEVEQEETAQDDSEIIDLTSSDEKGD